MRMMLMVMLALAAVLTACEDTGDRRTDAESAETLLPTIVGYERIDADSLVNAVTAAGSGAALASGNAPLAAGIARAEAVVQCLQDRGAVAANMYVQSTQTDIVPQAGAVVVINETRLSQNILSCLTDVGGASAQNLTDYIEPCTGTGRFAFQGDDFSYMYVGVGGDLCGFFNQHFTNLEAAAPTPAATE